MLVHIKVFDLDDSEDFGFDHPETFADQLAAVQADTTNVRVRIDGGNPMTVHQAIAFLQGMAVGDYRPEDVCECVPAELCCDLGEVGG